MIAKHISLISGSVNTKAVLLEQLKEYIGDFAIIKTYVIDNGIDQKISDELIVVSSKSAYDELIHLDKLDTSCEIIIANRTINHRNIEDIVLLSPELYVLFVSDNKESCYDGIEALNKLGLDYLNYIPYYPGRKINYFTTEIAITTGEVDKIPSSISKVFDIGPRILDFTTITNILNKLEILDCKAGQFSQEFLKKIINIAKKLANSNNQISNLNEHLNLVIDGLNDGLLVFDHKGYISVFNENLKKIMNMEYSCVLGKNIKNIISNKSLLRFLIDDNEEMKKVLKIYNKSVIVKKVQIQKSNSKIIIFKTIEEVLENERFTREYIRKGFYAKYTFDDMIGNSERFVKVKEVSRKLAGTDLTILIEGESGTGKELMASAIHNASKRKKGPFLAVNFSALPDELIESELFGYEEGAFTGAKKGGKEGLFEQANGGTIFLDEIGDISHKVQSRLLRVLQEKEVMRIGGTDIKPIDVRVIAATNKDLSKMVLDKKFREDLYYRLKMGYIRLIPLRERKEDIMPIINYFIKTETSENITISDGLEKELKKYAWYGNVREIKNILSYMLAVRESNTLNLADIPDKRFFMSFKKDSNEDIACLAMDMLNEEYIFILEKIYEISSNGAVVGREKIADATEDTDYEMTKYQIRTRLNYLEKKGLIIKRKGTHGTVLTEKGEKVLMANKNTKGK